MFVEDDPVLMNAYVKHFQEMKDVKLLQAYDGQHAIEILNRTQPDLLVTGINMPKKSGFDLLQHVSKKRYLFPTIVLTNMDDEASRTQAIALGAKEYLVKKNLKIVNLESIVKKYLRQTNP